MKSIEWDPLSTDYLLVSTAQSMIMLVDANTASVLMYFELPSAAAEVHTLAWIPSAPGMFLSGGEPADIFKLLSVWRTVFIDIAVSMQVTVSKALGHQIIYSVKSQRCGQSMTWFACLGHVGFNFGIVC